MSTTLALAAERARQSARVAMPARWLDAAAVMAIAVCALALHRDGLTGGPAFYELDTRLFYFPLAQWVGQQLHAGFFPLWLPGIFTGYPIFADGELGLAYLPQIALLGALPASIAMVWLRVLHVFLAGLFTFLYLRTLRLDTLPALGGGLVFALGSFLSTQMHHENVVRSAVWLPAVLTCFDRAVQQRPPWSTRRFLSWTALGALAFAQAALGLHVQPVLMAALAHGLYVVFRALLPTRGVRNAYWPLGSGAAILLVGLALAAVQWGPLAEWALVSSRRGGVDYVFASSFALAPANLLSLIFPYFFRLPDATTWWSLWQQWETELYVGIPTLSLVVLGITLSRRVEIIYFVLLGLLSLWISMADSAPLFNLHQVLWSVPGFSFLRAPGRFTYLFVFACACLAGLGLQVLAQRRFRIVVALAGGAPTVAALAALLALLPGWRNWLVADPTRATALIQSTYLAGRAQYAIEPGLALNGLVTSLDIMSVKTAWSLVLLVLTVLAFVVWLEFGQRRLFLSQAVFVGLLAVDLLVFSFDFHPRSPLASLEPALGADPGQRVLMHDAVDLPAFEPDQLLADGISMSGGYSSLPSQRHVELEASTSTDPGLFDLWSAPLVIEPATPADLRVVEGVRFRFQHPLFAGFGGSSPQTFQVPPGVGPIVGLRLIGTLSYGFNAPQDREVATVRVGTQTLPLRAGVELSERAFDRPSLKGLVQHQKAADALDFEEATPEGEAYIAHLYQADVPLTTAVSVDSLTVTSTDPTVRVELYGIGLIDSNGGVHSLDIADRTGMQRLSDVLVQNSNALPRAYLIPAAQAFSPARHAGLTATQLVASPDMDVHTMVLIENDPNAPSTPDGSTEARAARQVQDLGPNAVRVIADTDEPCYLVLADFYHRGWTARIDGQPARVFIANALFRAVAIDAGTHTVEFRFEPLSHELGAAVSAVTLVALLLLLGACMRRA